MTINNAAPEPFIVTHLPWMVDAECRGVRVSVFFLERGEGHAKAAKAICAECPVKAQCLEWAVYGGPEHTGEHHGIWAGTTPRERSKMRGCTRADEAVCGTESGYARHRRNGEAVCEPCRVAHNTDRRNYALRLRAVAA